MSIFRPDSRETIPLEPVDIRFRDVSREDVRHYLTGINSTRTDESRAYYIPSRVYGEWTMVTKENADEMEAQVRNNYAPFYPEFARVNDDVDGTVPPATSAPSMTSGWMSRIADRLFSF